MKRVIFAVALLAINVGILFGLTACNEHKHNFRKTDEVAATCTEDGYTVFECDCGESYTVDGARATFHSLVNHAGHAKTTCEEVGWDAYVTCKNCDYTTYREIPPTLHSFVEHEIKIQMSCEEIGWDAYVTCENCEYTTYKEISGHSIVHHSAHTATCEEAGWNEYEECMRCGYTTFEKIPALGHQKNENFICDRCGKLASTLEKLRFKLNEDGLGYSVFKAYDQIAGEVIIPAYYEGLPITHVDGFQHCKDITEVYIGGGIINNSAFFWLNKLKNVTIGENVTLIDLGAFSRCYNLEHVKILDGVDMTLNCPFEYCFSLTEFEISARVTEIYGSFLDYSAVKTLTIPKTVKNMHPDAAGNPDAEDLCMFIDLNIHGLELLTIEGNPMRLHAVIRVPNGAAICVEPQYVDQWKELYREKHITDLGAMFQLLFLVDSIYPIGDGVFHNQTFRYLLNNGEATILRFIGDEPCAIPTEIDGYPVGGVSKNFLNVPFDGYETLHKGDFRYYYYSLSENQKRLYDDMLLCANNFLRNKADIIPYAFGFSIGEFLYTDYGVGYSDLNVMWKAFLCDNQSFYWMRLETSLLIEAQVDYITGDMYEFPPHYVSTGPQCCWLCIELNYALKYSTREEATLGILNCLKQLEDEMAAFDTDIKKITFLYDFVLNKTTYEWENDLPSNSITSHNIVGVLDDDVNTNSVCEGYAKAFAFLCNYFGVDCLLVTGTEMAHAWNLVKIDDVWYWADPTWDDTIIEAGGDVYLYFLNGDEFLSDHTCDLSTGEKMDWLGELPAVSKTAYELS